MNPINSTILNGNTIYTECNKSPLVALPLVISGSNSKTNQITLPTTNRNNNNNNNNDTNQIILSHSLLNHDNLLFNIAGNQHIAFSTDQSKLLNKILYNKTFFFFFFFFQTLVK
jgi:hypothetical protein